MDPFARLLPFLRPYRWRAAAALVLLTALVCMDLAIPRLIQRTIDQGIARQDQEAVLTTALLMLGISLLSLLVAVVNNLLSVQVAEGLARDLRDALFTKIQTYAFADLDRKQTGQWLVRLTSDTQAVQRVVMISLRIGTRAPLLMVGSLILMIDTSPALALVMLPLLIVTSAILVLFVGRSEPFFQAVQQSLDSLNTILQENIAGVRLVKSFVRADFEIRRFEQASLAFTERTITAMQIMATLSPVLTLCVNAGMVIVIWVGGLHAIDGRLTVGQIVAFTNYLLTTMTPLIMMTILSNVWAGGIVSARRLTEVLDTVPAVREAADAIAWPLTAPGRLVFENVQFRYDGLDTKPVLTGIVLTVEPGETVAFLGATGAGKSTLVQLVPRFYDVTGGRILLDGIDLRQLTEASLRSRIAIVPQETVLFSGTVRDNIRYGAPGAGEAEIRAAAQAAQAHAFIAALPQGYDTRIEERGTNLSGGQKQRIAIARALLMRPTILILDDATSAVDVETESLVQEGLAAVRKGATTLVVAQRISTVLRADRIVVIEGGRIAAEGTHRALLAESPLYREIFDSQLGDYPGVDPAGLVAGGDGAAALRAASGEGSR
jgi:ATP-binding cassette subfamily B protein